MSNYYINKDNKSGEIVYLEYDKDNAYKVNPKTKKKDEIEVNKIVFVSPTLTEKLIKKKIDRKVTSLLAELNTIDDNDDEDGGVRVRDKLVEAERLKLNIINNYGKYLGVKFTSLTLKKLQLIIDSYRSKLYMIKGKQQEQIFLNMFKNAEAIEETENRGKRGR